jgi:hypothetical protein
VGLFSLTIRELYKKRGRVRCTVSCALSGGGGGGGGGSAVSRVGNSIFGFVGFGRGLVILQGDGGVRLYLVVFDVWVGLVSLSV